MFAKHIFYLLRIKEEEEEDAKFKGTQKPLCGHELYLEQRFSVQLTTSVHIWFDY